MEHVVEAQVIDSHHLRLKKPIELAPGSHVVITIETPEGVAEEQEWYLLSSRSLEEAYGAEEPEYSADMVKVPNPDYQP